MYIHQVYIYIKFIYIYKNLIIYVYGHIFFKMTRIFLILWFLSIHLYQRQPII